MLDLELASGDIRLSVRRFTVEESLSAPFTISLSAMSPDENLDLEAATGRPARFRIRGRAESHVPERVWTGICASARQTRADASEAGLSSYSILLVPRLWLLGRRRNHRLFQHRSVPEIVARLLEEWGVEHAWAIERSSYPPLELRVQHGESDLDFVDRLLEEAGITYFFEEGRTGESVMRLCDRPQAAEPIPPMPFADATFQASAGRLDFVTAVTVGHEVRAGKYTIRDFDFRRPAAALEASTVQAEPPETPLERYVYEPGSFLVERASAGGRQAPRTDTPVADDLGIARFDERAGRERAERTAEAHRAGRREVTFESMALYPAPGAVLSITGHPRAGAGAPLLVTSSVLKGQVAEAGEEWTLAARAVPAAAPYRPPLRTPKPKMFGLQSALVVGPPGEEIYTDEHGRVRVQFHWDREGTRDPHSSVWMRVASGWAGTHFGVVRIPRVGQEVLVAFLDGDPDSPVITGSVFNAVTAVPYRLPEHKTVSTWKSSSSPGGDGANELKMEDRKHHELVYLQAERDHARLIKHDEVSLVGHDRTSVVENDETVSVRRDRTKVVQHDERVTVGHDRTQQVKGDEALAVGRDRAQVVLRNEVAATGASSTVAVGLSRRTAVGVEDVSSVGTRFEVAIRPGIAPKMARGLSGTVEAGPLGALFGALPDLLGRAAGGALGGLVSQLAGPSFRDTPLPSFLQRPLDALAPHLPRAAASVIAAAAAPFERLAGGGGPPGAEASSAPTHIEMIHKRIRLTTGEATLTLEGPDVRIEASGEISIAAKKRVLVRSEGDDVVIRGGPMVLINPSGAGGESSGEQG